MTDWIRSLLSIGATDEEDAEERLRRALLIAAAALVMPAAALWGLMYLAFGEPRSALVPWSFVLISSVAMVALARTRNYEVFAGVIFITFLILPFLLMWSLGGFVSGSAVALWSWLSPLGARIVGHRRTAVLLFTGFALGLIISALVQPRLDPTNRLSDGVIVTLFVLNVVAVGGITLVLVDASSGGREGSLESMRGVVRRYFSSDVAAAILSDPGRQELGGEVAEITVLFADLGGYTTYAGDRPPDEVVELLNTIFAEAVPAIIQEDGTPIQLPGDAVMAIFGAPRAMPDHAQRAARAALAIQDRGRALAADHPGWPRFRIGLNSGPAVVGNIGSDEFRNFTAIGDTVNMAQRFQTMAEPGQVVTGPSTAELLDDGAVLEWLDARPVKGKSEAVRPCVIRSVSDAATSLLG
jgi:class 3 adenylate cyclase